MLGSYFMRVVAAVHTKIYLATFLMYGSNRSELMGFKT